MNRDRRELARRAYERGRWRIAAPWCAPVAGLTGIAWALGAWAAPAVGAALAGVLVTLKWRGGAIGKAAATGLGAGLVPYALVLAWGCYGSCAFGHCLVIGLAAGAAGAGVLLATLGSAGSIDARSAGPIAAGVGVAVLVASLACPLLGTPGLVVVPVLALAAVPLAIRRHA
jgi:hypothetical protein